MSTRPVRLRRIPRTTISSEREDDETEVVEAGLALDVDSAEDRVPIDPEAGQPLPGEEARWLAVLAEQLLVEQVRRHDSANASVITASVRPRRRSAG